MLLHALAQALLKLFTRYCRPRSDRQARALPQQLAAQLIHGDSGRHYAAAGIGEAGQLKQTLQRTVFTAATVQGNKDLVEAHALKLGDIGVTRIHRMGIHTAFA